MQTSNKRIFLVACQLAHVSHIQGAPLDELFKSLLFISQCRNLCCQSLPLAQAPLYLQQTATPVSEWGGGNYKWSRSHSSTCPYYSIFLGYIIRYDDKYCKESKLWVTRQKYSLVPLVALTCQNQIIGWPTNSPKPKHCLLMTLNDKERQPMQYPRSLWSWSHSMFFSVLTRENCQLSSCRFVFFQSRRSIAKMIQL